MLNFYSLILDFVFKKYYGAQAFEKLSYHISKTNMYSSLSHPTPTATPKKKMQIHLVPTHIYHQKEQRLGNIDIERVSIKTLKKIKLCIL